MRLFEEYGTPSTAGDITYIDYLVGWLAGGLCVGHACLLCAVALSGKAVMRMRLGILVATLLRPGGQRILAQLFPVFSPPSPTRQFLGDFVDRGAHSLETICLLLALKIEHPRNVHLIRGNHEVRDAVQQWATTARCKEQSL